MRTPLRIEAELTERDLARVAPAEGGAGVRQRVLAIRLIVMGQTVPQAAPMVGLKERQVRNWVHRFQAEGFEGLRDSPRPGQPKHLPTKKKKPSRPAFGGLPVAGSYVGRTFGAC